jgi:hypothetical protein
MATQVTCSSLRRFIEAGLSSGRRIGGSRPGDRGFSAAEFAHHMRMTTREAWAALDQLAAEDLVTWVSTQDGHDERWCLTKNGVYVVETIQKSKNRVQRKAASAIGERLTSLNAVLGDFAEIGRVVGCGPWLHGHEYGPVIVGLEVDGWGQVPAGQRLEMIVRVLDSLALEGALPRRQLPDVVVIGYDSRNGVPWRLRMHKVIGARVMPPGMKGGQLVTVERSALDVDESIYQSELDSLATDLGMWNEKAGRQEEFSLRWWDLIGEVTSLTSEQARVEARRLLSAKAMIGFEMAAARKAPCAAISPKRRPKVLPAKQRLEDEAERKEKSDFDKEDRWRQSHRWDGAKSRLELNFESPGFYVPEGVIGAHADAMYESGVLETASVAQARTLGSLVEESEIQLAYQDVRRVWLDDLRVEREARSAATPAPPQRKTEVEYLTVFALGLGEPMPVGVVRQPLSQEKALRQVLDLVAAGCARRLVKVYGKRMHTHLVGDGEPFYRSTHDLSFLMWSYRRSTPEEQAMLEGVSSKLGRVVNSVRIDSSGKTTASLRGLLETEVIEGGCGLDTIVEGPDLPIRMHGYQEAKKELDVTREAVGQVFFGDFDERWLDAQRTGLFDALSLLSHSQEHKVGRRLRVALWGRRDEAQGSGGPRVVQRESGLMEVRAEFKDGSLTWLVRGDVVVPKVVFERKGVPGPRRFAQLPAEREVDGGLLELRYKGEVVSWPLVGVRRDGKPMGVCLALSEPFLKALLWFCGGDAVQKAKTWVPENLYHVPKVREMLAEARRAEKQERDEAERLSEADETDSPPSAVVEVLKLTDIQWLAALVDLGLGLSNHEVFANWRQGGLAASL